MQTSIKDLFILALVVVILFGFFVLSANAEEEVCAAIHPCYANGEIFPEFNLPGFCGDKYRAECMKVKASLMSDDLVACQTENLKYKSNEAKLSKKIRALRKQLKK